MNQGKKLVHGKIYGGRMLSSVGSGTTLVLKVCGICSVVAVAGGHGGNESNSGGSHPGPTLHCLRYRQGSSLQAGIVLCQFPYLRAAPLLSAFAKSFSSAVSRRQIHSCKVVPAEYTVNEDGEEATLEFRVFFSDKSGKTLKSFVKIFPGVKHGWTVRYDEHDEHAVEEANEAHTLMIDWFAKYL